VAEVVERRVRRTRRNLQDALIALILERGYAGITVQHVLDRADVGRSTFYTHFRDLEALLLSCFEELRDELRRDWDALALGAPLQDPGRPSFVLFAHAYRHRPVYRALCGRRGGEIVYRHLHTMVGEVLREHLALHQCAESAIPADAVVEVYTSGLLGMLTWWVDQNFPHGPRRVAQMYGTMANPGITAALGRQALRAD
jgi:AcrR family transcriptional regulator